MKFKTYRETPHQGWTIQHTWRTSADRPGPDGFDRVAVKAGKRVAQLPDETWASFTRRLDVLDGRHQPQAGPSKRLSSPKPERKPAPPTHGPSPTPLFDEVL